MAVPITNCRSFPHVRGGRPHPCRPPSARHQRGRTDRLLDALHPRLEAANTVRPVGPVCRPNGSSKLFCSWPFTPSAANDNSASRSTSISSSAGSGTCRPARTPSMPPPSPRIADAWKRTASPSSVLRRRRRRGVDRQPVQRTLQRRRHASSRSFATCKSFRPRDRGRREGSESAGRQRLQARQPRRRFPAASGGPERNGTRAGRIPRRSFYRKGRGKEAKHRTWGTCSPRNLNGLIVTPAAATEANGTAERDRRRWICSTTWKSTARPRAHDAGRRQGLRRRRLLRELRRPPDRATYVPLVKVPVDPKTVTQHKKATSGDSGRRLR